MLKRVSIQNFKSLKDVTLDLQKVNLLIGPNNSGKTNFLKALEFLGKWVSNSLPESVITPNITFRASEKNYSAQKASWLLSVDADTKGEWGNYQIGVSSNYGSVKYEEAAWTSKEGDVKNSKANHSKIDAQPHQGITLDGAQQKDVQYFPSRFLLGYAKSTPFLFPGNILRLFDDIKIYKPDPNKLTQAGPVGTGEEIVNADASNLVGFLDLMLGKYRRNVFNRTEIDLHTCIPEFDEINLDDVSPTEEVRKQFGDKSFKRIGLTNSKEAITYWADELSEGTLYFLALLCIINQPNPPKLLLLEEPEKGIHPRRIREVMDFIFRLAEEKDVQIILTSHNEHVLDDFITRPEAVFVFDKDEEGATYVRNLQTDIIEPTNRRNQELGLDEIDLTTNLSENWLYGLLGGVPSIP